jgi:two-component system response regulator FixJ
MVYRGGNIKKATVYVVDDDEQVRATLSNVLRFGNYDFRTFSDPLQLLNYPLSTEYSCLILDLTLPSMSGLELQRKLVQKGLVLPVIIYSGNACIDTAVSAMTGGAFTVLQKPVDNKVLTATIDRAIADFAIKRGDSVKNKQAFEYLKVLSKRELEIARLISAGQTSVSIAEDLNLSTRTVEAHRAAIFIKLQIKAAGPLAQLMLRADLHTSSQPFKG